MNGYASDITCNTSSSISIIALKHDSCSEGSPKSAISLAALRRAHLGRDQPVFGRFDRGCGARFVVTHWQVIFGIIYSKLSNCQNIVSETNQTVGKHNFDWSSPRFTNLQWSQRIPLLSLYYSVYDYVLAGFLGFNWFTRRLRHHLSATEKIFRTQDFFELTSGVDLVVAF